MKLRIQDLPEDGVRSIIDAILQVDLGARINFDASLVSIAGRMTVDDASAAIERSGYQVAAIVDQTLIDAGFRYKPHDIRSF
ncbi:hypothetical protein [Noviluteimonas gilva]|uniref:HMA domain-containing protein n=1 Tax=Noviluteimonas gilva TaxID=2682097 RepID=A0A7C9LQV2_9GAMM|nr:hypothetical protein [Lysobacter gilvus]MUV15743.1 hypothetical protein [Lysobacter gilvus]